MSECALGNDHKQATVSHGPQTENRVKFPLLVNKDHKAPLPLFSVSFSLLFSIQPHLIVCGCNSEKGIVSLGLKLCHYLHYWSPSSLALTSALSHDFF